jgi:hypothetical protein
MMISMGHEKADKKFESLGQLAMSEGFELRR